MVIQVPASKTYWRGSAHCSGLDSRLRDRRGRHRWTADLRCDDLVLALGEHRLYEVAVLVCGLRRER
jgi:hypothetical protein